MQLCKWPIFDFAAAHLGTSLAVTPDSEVNTIRFLWLECELYCTLYSLMRYEIKMLPSHCKGCISTLDSNRRVLVATSSRIVWSESDGVAGDYFINL